MKYIIILTIIIIAHANAFTQNNNNNENESWSYTNYTKQSIYISMRDGVKLYTSIYTPNDNSAKHPILLTRTPYTIAPYTDKFNSRLYSSYQINYLKKGYIIVHQDVRGKWMSEGTFVDVRPYIANKKGSEIDEASDTYDTIDWLVNNIKNTNGNVGVFGTSYPGFYSTMAALSNHPSLKAVSPQAPVTDWFMGDDFHHNGAFCIMDAFQFYKNFGIKRAEPTTKSYGNSYKITNTDNYNFYLNVGAIPNFSKLLGDSIAFWKDVLAHPNYDAWWQARNTRNSMSNIKPAMLTVGGNFDAEDCYGAWNLYKAIEKQSPATNNKIVMGPWVHGGWSRNDGNYLGNVRFAQLTSPWYQQNVEIPFFEQYLNNGADAALAEATVFYTGTNEWKKLASWPPVGVTAAKYYLHNTGSLVTSVINNNSNSNNKFATYTSNPNKPVPYTEAVHSSRTREYMTDDQRFAARRPDVLVYETEHLQNDITIAGELLANLQVAISTTDADFVVKLIDVFPENFAYDSTYYNKGDKPNPYPMGGYQMLVRGEIMRGKYRNSFTTPAPFVPNKVTTVQYTLPDVAHVFKKGHRIMVQVQSTWFPLFDRNPQTFCNIYQATNKDFKPATIKVYSGSYISLPVVK